MNLKRQLLLVSLLTLMLPWAGCQFIRETESALRSSQQQMLAGTARAIADRMAQYPEEFPLAVKSDHLLGDQLYGHRLESVPSIDGYFEDWSIGEASLRNLRGIDGPVRFAVGLHKQFVYIFVEVQDRQVIYTRPGALANADRVVLISSNPPYLTETFSFVAEAPGPVVSYLESSSGSAPAATIHAYWQDTPTGYNIEARVPRNRLGTHLGIAVDNTEDRGQPAIRSASFTARAPGSLVAISPELTRITDGLVQSGLRLIVTDASGWRIAMAGDLQTSTADVNSPVSRWLQIAYKTIVEPGTEPAFAEPDPSGREQQPYVKSAISGQPHAAWFRSADDGRAIVAVAEPVTSPLQSDQAAIGTVVLQQGTEEILSLTNQGLARLMNVTMIAFLLVAGALLGYATLLSRRIRRLSIAAEQALESDHLRVALPSSTSSDEIGDLSRSFSNILTQLGEYNDYLRTLASKLSHELRTPLAIVTSSLDNLEHEPLSDASKGYTERAKDGANRLRRILAAMSEASRVEELMKNAEAESLDLDVVLQSMVTAYRDAYPARNFALDIGGGPFTMLGSPELLIQMLDKLVDNAVSFSADDDTITIDLNQDGSHLRLDIHNPGPPLPQRMRGQLFDSMVSVRANKDQQHLGLGLYIAKLIADGHNGRIDADTVDNGVRFSVSLPISS